jgi:hypothetical protein
LLTLSIDELIIVCNDNTAVNIDITKVSDHLANLYTLSQSDERFIFWESDDVTVSARKTFINGETNFALTADTAFPAVIIIA